MALTKISTGGVKDDTADEAKLKVSNAGTNGQFLQKQSGNTGGLTWADVPAAVGGADGVDFDDNVKARFGTGNDLSLYHDGSNSYIDNSTGAVQLRTDNLQIKNAAGNESLIRASANGTTELYYDNSKKLETISGGVDVTGAIYVNGSALSTAPTITGTASGAISAANKACGVNTDGTISEIKNTTISAGTGSNTDIPHGSGYTTNAREVVWISATKFIIFWSELNNSGKLFAAVGTVSGTTISYGSRTAIGGAGTTNNPTLVNNFVSASYDSQSDAVVVFYTHTQSGGGDNNVVGFMIQGITVSGTTITVSSTAYDDIATSGGGQLHVGRVVCDNYGGFAIAYSIASNAACYIRPGTVSSAGAISLGTAWHMGNGIGSGYPHGVALAYDEKKARFLILFRDVYANLKGGIYARSGTSMTRYEGGTPIQVTTGVDANSIGAIYDYNTSQFLITFKNNSNGNIMYLLRSINGAGSGLTATATDTLTTTTQDVYAFLAGDKVSGKAFLLYAGASNTQFLTITVGATSVTSSAETIASHKEETGLALACNGSGMVLTAVTESDDADIDTRAKQFEVTTSNLTANNFIGFSDAAYSNGATATIKVVGNTTTQSSLEPSKTYYVQEAGTLSTTADDPSVIAGKALTSTSLLIHY